ncbi:hypothetical protein LCGC14_0610270 [marine sediment metagenome]|uniref:DUF2800 domain-containing protein n=1 Tax=marine sediment metagenome TaxID=412755 RepID=A0A0F9UGA5_9ZZZZ
MNNLPQHSPLGGSGAYRWIPCPGSVTLSHGVEEDESEYAALGTTAHIVGEHCLKKDLDAWEWIGGLIDNYSDTPDIRVNKEMADAVQVYLNGVRSAHPNRNQSNFFIEKRFHRPDLHKYFYGQSDVAYVDMEARQLDIWDLKYGVGIIVEVARNPQGMYYACGILEELDLWDDIDKVVIHIAQPRGFHFDGPLREWEISVDDLAEWLHDTLLPAMDKALVSCDTQSGEHCRFCPARGRACPQILKDFDELEIMINEIDEKGSAAKLTNAQVGRFMDLLDVAKIVGAAATKTAFARLSAGKKIPGRKLIKARSNREFKPDTEDAAKAKFGNRAYTEIKLKSPAQIDEMPEGKTFTARYAFKPDKGLTVGKASSTRPAVDTSNKSLFKPQKGKK